SGNNVAATFDPTVLPNDMWVITITSTASGGGVDTLDIPVAVQGDLKPGRFVVSYTDAVARVDGFDIAVRRTYDSLERGGKYEFGNGWRLDYGSIRIGSNGSLSDGGWT